MSDANALQRIHTKVDGEATLTALVTAVCPEDGSQDHYTLTVEYQPDGKVVEYHSLRAYLDGFHDKQMADHDICYSVYYDLLGLLDPESLTVTLTGTHRGIEAEVTLP